MKSGYLSQFVFIARTKTEKDYEPSSFRIILASVERHFKSLQLGKTIFQDSDFKKTRDVLKAKPKQLKTHAHGNSPKATTALMDDKIGTVFDKQLLGLSSSQALLKCA